MNLSTWRRKTRKTWRKPFVYQIFRTSLEQEVFHLVVYCTNTISYHTRCDQRSSSSQSDSPYRSSDPSCRCTSWMDKSGTTWSRGSRSIPSDTLLVDMLKINLTLLLPQFLGSVTIFLSSQLILIILTSLTPILCEWYRLANMSFESTWHHIPYIRWQESLLYKKSILHLGLKFNNNIISNSTSQSSTWTVPSLLTKCSSNVFDEKLDSLIADNF